MFSLLALSHPALRAGSSAKENGAHGHGRGRRSACSLVFQKAPELLEEGVLPLAGGLPWPGGVAVEAVPGSPPRRPLVHQIVEGLAALVVVGGRGRGSRSPPGRCPRPPDRRSQGAQDGVAEPGAVLHGCVDFLRPAAPVARMWRASRITAYCRRLPRMPRMSFWTMTGFFPRARARAWTAWAAAWLVWSPG